LEAILNKSRIINKSHDIENRMKIRIKKPYQEDEFEFPFITVDLIHFHDLLPSKQGIDFLREAHAF